MFFATNNRPILREQSYAKWRRLRLIPFMKTITSEERNTALTEKLRGELSWILTWAVEGCRRYLESGQETPEIVTAATQDYLSGENPIDK